MKGQNQRSSNPGVVSSQSDYRYKNSSFNNSGNKYNKQYAANNTRINKMADEQIVGTLKYHSLNSRGSPEVLRKRLREFMRRQMDGEDTLPTVDNMYSYFLIIDFEATCDEVNATDFQHEIIEFPIVLYDVVLRRKVDVFHEYCKPQINPTLSNFCKSLTSIDQATIDTARSFRNVLTEVEQWLNKHRMFAKSFAIVCDCNADMAKFMRIQCAISDMEFPAWCRQWINVVKAFRLFYGVPNDVKLNMQKMLSSLGLEFEGRQHSGLNDAENILRITETMMSDGCQLRVNEKLDECPPHFTAAVTRKEAEAVNCYCSADQEDDVLSKTSASVRPFSTVTDSLRDLQLGTLSIGGGESMVPH